MKYNSVTVKLFFRKGKRFSVPDRKHKILISNTGKLGFRTERYGYLAFKRFRLPKLTVLAACAVVYLKLPFAI